MIDPTTLTLERAVRRFVEDGTQLTPRGQNVIPGNDGGPAPNGLYASVLAISQAGDGVPYHTSSARPDGETLDIQTINTIRATFSVQFYRKGARDLARRFAVWCSSPSGNTAALESGLTFLRTSEVRQLDSIISDDWEERAGLDLEIGYLERIAEVVDIISSAEIDVEADGEPFEHIEVDI